MLAPVRQQRDFDCNDVAAVNCHKLACCWLGPFAFRLLHRISQLSDSKRQQTGSARARMKWRQTRLLRIALKIETSNGIVCLNW